MSTTPVPSEQLPRPRRRIVYRDGRYSTVHRFHYAAAHLEAFSAPAGSGTSTS